MTAHGPFRYRNLVPNDVDPSGRRFAAIQRSDVTQPQPVKINFVVNWFDELRRHTAGRDRAAPQ